MLKRDIYEFDTAFANTVLKTMTVYVRQACLSLQGTATFAEEAVLPKVFTAPEPGMGSAIVFGLCFFFFYDGVKTSFPVSFGMIIFKMGNPPFCLGILRDRLHPPMSFFSLRKGEIALGAFLLLNCHGFMILGYRYSTS